MAQLGQKAVDVVTEEETGYQLLQVKICITAARCIELQHGKSAFSVPILTKPRQMAGRFSQTVR